MKNELNMQYVFSDKIVNANHVQEVYDKYVSFWHDYLAIELDVDKNHIDIEINAVQSYAWVTNLHFNFFVDAHTSLHKGPAKLNNMQQVFKVRTEFNSAVLSAIESTQNDIPALATEFCDSFAETYEKPVAKRIRLLIEHKPSFVYEKKCETCGGKRKVLCETCAGHGRVSCGNCSGSGLVICSECKGTKRAACPTCNGSGRVSFTCDTCNGTGHYEDFIGRRQLTKQCSCGGKSTYGCNRCDHEHKVACENCDRNGQERCCRCYGRGHVKCKVCGGTKYVRCEGCEGTGLLHEVYTVQIAEKVTWDTTHPSVKKDLPIIIIDDYSGYTLRAYGLGDDKKSIHATYSNMIFISKIQVKYARFYTDLIVYNQHISNDFRLLQTFAHNVFIYSTQDIVNKTSIRKNLSLGFWDINLGVIKKYDRMIYKYEDKDKKSEQDKQYDEILCAALSNISKRQTFFYTLIHILTFILVLNFAEFLVADGIIAHNNIFTKAIDITTSYLVNPIFFVVNFLLGVIAFILSIFISGGIELSLERIFTFIKHLIGYTAEFINKKLNIPTVGLPFANSVKERTVYIVLQGTFFYIFAKFKILNRISKLAKKDNKQLNASFLQDLKDAKPQKCWVSWWFLGALIPLLSFMF